MVFRVILELHGFLRYFTEIRLIELTGMITKIALFDQEIHVLLEVVLGLRILNDLCGLAGPETRNGSMNIPLAASRKGQSAA